MFYEAWLLFYLATVANFESQFVLNDEDGVESKHSNNGFMLNRKFYVCDREYSCTHVIKYEDSDQYETVNGDQELRKIAKRKSVWKKIKLVETNCKKEYDRGHREDGIYEYIDENKKNTFPIFCKMTVEAKGYVVIQRRISKSTDFNRSWKDYESGFGNIKENYWIGLKRLHLIARSGLSAKLRVDVRHISDPDKTYYAKYTKFEIGNEADGYKLTIGGYQGNAGDSLKVHNGRIFSTYDKGENSGKCGKYHLGGWWFNPFHPSCYGGGSFLNGRFPSESADPQFQEISWYELKSKQRGIIYSRMMVTY